MAKPLSDILKGVKASKTEPGSTGSDPGVDYAPKAKAERDWVADKNMVKVYVLFPKSDFSIRTTLIHVTGFANVLGVHNFAAAGSHIELNFINA